jgi:uncharacterized damage-inducible protein DinB/gamma-glutamylcyclotransferase (GGCT)/AIG2-like uncharacterized protein YtfP
MPFLFAYGTLQERDVQRSTFGRPLSGENDALVGFERSMAGSHANVRFTGRPDDRVSGIVFEISEGDLAAADRYEQRASFRRIAATLASGKQAWVYVDSGPADSRRSRVDAATVDSSLIARELLRLVEQSVWANLKWVEFVYAQADSELRPRELLSHIMLGERVWFERIENRQTTTTTFPVMDKEELVRGFTENVETFHRLIGSRLEDVVHFRRASGEEYHASVKDILYHLFTHGYHHRGQLAAHYARSGPKYPSTDHIDYLIQNKL